MTVKNRIIAGTIGAVVTILLIGGVLFATWPRPGPLNCLNAMLCMATQTWVGDQHGASTITLVSDPALHNTQAMWQRYLEVASGLSNVSVGIEKDKGGGEANTVCGGGSDGLYYFVKAFKNDTQVASDFCKPVPKGDINTPVSMEISYYVSHGGGVNVWLTTRSQDVHIGFPGALGTYSTINEVEAISDKVMGHEVWGTVWIANKYQTVSPGTPFYYQQVPGKLSVADPPTMYWSMTPTLKSSGGTLVSCVYQESAPQCTLGS